MESRITDHSRGVMPDIQGPDSDELRDIPYPATAIAIVGVACRFAGADSLEDLWTILQTGTSQHVDVPEHRFPDSRFERRRYRGNFQASVLNDVDAFDHKFFGVPSREAGFRDPQQRLALEVTYQALESAGYFAREITEEQRDIGCYIATAMNEYRENVVTHAPSAFSLTGSIRPFIAGQVSHYFGWTGPAIMIDAACAASGAAVNIACRAIASGECKSAIAGATNIFISPDTFQDLASGHFISPTGPSRPFDALADGYGRGEGVAVVVLKKLSDALKDGDVVKGVISATATNQCANESPITVPHAPTQSSLYRKALKLAQLDANQIGYVEAHGTGTRVGDPIEADSIRAVFGNLDRGPGKVTYMGSLKSNIGHTEATSGLSGLIKVMLMIEKGIIPQQALFTTLHPNIPPLGPYGLEIPTKNIPWTSKYRAGCINNYGASGCNAVMILTQPPVRAAKEPKPRITTSPVSITAFSRKSLNSYCLTLLEFLDQADASDSLVLDISFHLSRRRNPQLPFSVAASISDLQELKNFLVSAQAGPIQPSENQKVPTILFFGGQEGKGISISQTFYNSCSVFRRHIDDCEATLRALGCHSMFPTLFEPDGCENSILAHSKLFSVQYASAKAWIDCGLQPSRVIGHSFGQLTALCVSGALSLQDALYLVTSRARLIDEIWVSDAGSMIAVETTRDELSELLGRHRDIDLEVACYNGVRSYVLAGTTSSVDAIETVLKASASSYRFKRLQVPNAFHSALAEPLIKPLQKVAEGLNWKKPDILLEACCERDTWQSINPVVVASQIREPVYFHQAVQRIAKQLGPCLWIEAGSGNNASLLRRALEPQTSHHEVRSIKLDSSSSLRNLTELTADLWRSNLKVQFWPFHHGQHHQYQTLNLPPYQFDKTRHWVEWQEMSPRSVAETPSIQEINPFIRRVRETKDECEFEINTQFESWRATCAEHYLLGVSVCPISVLLNLVSELIQTMQEVRRQRLQFHRVQHMKISAPIPAERDDRLSLKIGKVECSQLWTFRLTKTSDPHHEFAEGTLSMDNVEFQDFIRFERLIDPALIAKIRSDTNSDCIRGRGVYKIFAELLQVPVHHRAIQEVSAGSNEAVASLTSLSENPSLAIETLMHIPLICLNCIYDCPDGHLFLNTTVGDAQFRTRAPSPANTTASSSVYLKFFDLGTPEPTCDMYVFDTQNRKIIAIVVDVGFTSMLVGSLRKNLDSNGTTILEQAASREKEFSDISVPEEGRVSADQDSEQFSYHDESIDPGELPDVIPAIFDLLVRVTDVDANKIRESTLITDLGIDSLMWMEVADEINKFFAVDIGMAEFMLVENMGALCQLVADRSLGFSRSRRSDLESSSSLSTGPGTAASSPGTELSNGYGEPQAAHETLNHHETASPVLSDAAFEAFDQIRQDFDVLARETGCDSFWTTIHPLQNRLIEAYIVEAFEKLGCDVASSRVGETVPAVHCQPGRDRLLKQLMLVLRDTKLIKQSGNDWVCTDKIATARSSSVELFDQLQLQFPKWAPEHELLHVAGSNLAEHLDGTQDPLKLLFGSPAKRKLMADQYLRAPIQSAVSQQLASFIKKCIGLQKPGRALEVLEIGGGTCGTTVYALDAFVEAGIAVEYTFTDISPSFVAAAKSKLKNYNFIRYHTLDVSGTPPVEYRGRYDMIIATNVIHATPDAGRSAANVRQMLREGGFFTMVEYTHIYAAIDVIFGQLDGWWLFDDGRTHAIMNETEWRMTLKRAGYGTVDWTGSASRESEIMRIFLAA